MRQGLLVWVCGLFAAQMCAQLGLASLLGVDVGHQFVKAMVVSPSAPLELVLTPDSKRKDEVAVGIRRINGTRDVERAFGSEVVHMMARTPKNCFAHFKPLLGKSYQEDADAWRQYLAEYPAANITANKRHGISLMIDGTDYSAEMLLAMDFQQLINRGDNLIIENDPKSNDMVRDLALTVPDHYDQFQRRALLDAAEMAPAVATAVLVNDGIATAVNYALKLRDWTPGQKEYYMIYDMGSGSTKATLISIMKPEDDPKAPLVIELGGYGFDPDLGGNQYTLALMDLLQNQFVSEYNKVSLAKLKKNAKFNAKLRNAAERAKIILSANTETTVRIDSIVSDVDFIHKVTREDFEAAIVQRVNSALLPIEQALENQLWSENISEEQLKGILLMGGSVRVPLVLDMLTDYFGEEKIMKKLNADEAAVSGATVRAVKILETFKTRPLDVVERTTKDYSILLKGMNKEKVDIFPRGSVYPNVTYYVSEPIQDMDKEYIMELYENDLFLGGKQFTADDYKKSYDEVRCPHGVVFNATFEMTPSRIFEMKGVDLVCLKSPNAATSTNSSATLNEQDTEVSNEAGSKKNNRIKLVTAPVHGKMQTMKNTHKDTIKEHIYKMEQRDASTFELLRARHELESKLYSVNEFLVGLDEESPDFPTKQVNTLKNLKSEYMKWLEYESAKSSVTVVEEKIDKLDELMKRIRLFANSNDVDLTEKTMKALLAEANQTLQYFPDKEKEVYGQMDAMQVEYDEFDINVKEEFMNIKVPYQLASAVIHIERNSTALRSAVKEMQELFAENLFDSSTREDLLELKIRLSESLENLKVDIPSLERAVKYRFKELENIRNKKIRKMKREQKKKQKRESASQSIDTKSAVEEEENISRDTKTYETVSEMHDISMSLSTSTSAVKSTSIESSSSASKPSSKAKAKDSTSSMIPQDEL